MIIMVTKTIVFNYTTNELFDAPWNEQELCKID